MHHDNIIIPSYLLLLIFYFFIMIYVLYFSRITLVHMIFSNVINEDVYDSNLSLPLSFSSQSVHVLFLYSKHYLSSLVSP